jgi:4-amino-4-deoxy-L-arabinose transferase-like glycosyltransferase
MHEAVPSASIPARARRGLPGGLLRIAVILVAVACAGIAQHAGADNHLPWWLIPASLGSIVLAALAIPGPFAAPAESLRTPPGEGLRLEIGGAILCGSALIACAVWFTEPFTTLTRYVHTGSTYAALVWLFGIIVGLIVLWAGNRRPPDTGANMRSKMSPWFVVELLAVVIILDIAAGLRIWHLGSLPEGVWYDEADFVVSARQLLTLPFQPFGLQDVGHNPSLFFYVEAVIFKLVGASMASARLTPALFGTGAVLAVYLLGRAAAGVAVGLLAAALLALADWAIDFSRLDMSTVAPATLIGFGFAALAVAMYRPRGFWFALSGVLLGLAILTYAGGVLPGIGVALVVVGIRYLRDAEFRRASWPQALLLPLGAAVGGAPLLVPLLQDPGYVLDRARQVSIFTEYADWPHRITAIGSNLKVHLLMFSVQGDGNGRHNIPGTPMLDVVTGTCFFLGIGMALRRLNHWFYQLLLLWLIANMLGGILSLDYEAPQADRTAGAIASIALLAALPLAALVGILQEAVGRLLARGYRGAWTMQPATARSGPSTATAVLLAALVTCAPLGVAFSRNVQGYFVDHAHNISAWEEMGGLQAIVGRAAVELAARGYTVKLSPALNGDPALAWAAGEEPFASYDPEVPVQLGVPEGGLALIVPTSEPEVISFVRQSYPGATMLPLTPAFDKTNIQAEVLQISQADAQRNIGTTVTFGTGGRASAFDHMTGRMPWPVGSGPSTAVTVRGTLVVSGSAAWQIISIRAAGVRQGSIIIDGSTWNNAARGTGPIRLGAGNHSIEVIGRGKAGPDVELQWASGLLSGASALWGAVPPRNVGSPLLPSGGLLGLYYAGPTISGTPTLERVDETVYTYYQNPPPNLQFPFSTRWLGRVQAPKTGPYGFSLDSTGPSVLYIDGKAILSEQSGGPVASTTVPLTAGPHQIRIDYNATGGYLHVYLEWQPPGQLNYSPIPSRLLEPAHG